MRTQIKEIHRTIGRTMIYVTHDQAEALSMADRIAVMRRGRVVQAGTPYELYRRPQSAFVAEFIGGTNLLRGTLEETGDLLTVKTAAGLVRAKNGVPGIARGEAVLCSVRPESLRLASVGNSSGGPTVEGANQLLARVQSVMYLGDNEQFALRLADDSVIRAVEYNPSDKRAEPGEQIVLQFDPGAVVVLPQEEDLGD
jgi:ABC-type Fe3+/spermidine/putrescine transport system ATPase subunit